jgi:hypothetical protein
MYEAPELYELGDAAEVTLGRKLGDASDGAHGFTFAPVTPEELPEEE